MRVVYYHALRVDVDHFLHGLASFRHNAMRPQTVKPNVLPGVFNPILYQETHQRPFPLGHSLLLVIYLDS